MMVVRDSIEGLLGEKGKFWVEFVGVKLVY